MSIGAAFPDVLSAAQSGDRDALAALYRDTASLVIGYLRANRVSEAEDVAGDVFVSVVQGLDSFQGTEREFRSWLLTIAHRRMVDHIRRSTRRPPTVALDAADTAHAHTLPLEHEVLMNLRCRALADAMDDLSPLQRSAVMLRALADLTVPETARVMGKPESAVKALLRRATANLARAMQAEADTDRDPANRTDPSAGPATRPGPPAEPTVGSEPRRSGGRTRPAAVPAEPVRARARTVGPDRVPTRRRGPGATRSWQPADPEVWT